MTKHSGYVAGAWIGEAVTDRITVRNPATGAPLGDIPRLGAAETRRAIEAAAAALSEESSLDQRRTWLETIAEMLLKRRDALAATITAEQGKPTRESLAEVDYSAGFFRYFATELHHLEDRTLPGEIRSCRWVVRHRPAGVVGLIAPWNFPLAMLCKKLSAALAAGCAVVAKPAELTPLSAIALFEILHELRLPAGLVNLVMGDAPAIGQVMCEDARVRIVSFTGSTDVGRRLSVQAAPHLKRLSLELGGNAPFIVLRDADLQRAAEALMTNKFRAAGQTCVCANRIYVAREVVGAFVELLRPRVESLVVGNGALPTTDIGPLINKAAFAKVMRQVRHAMSLGATRVVGSDAVPPEHDWGCFFPPTLLQGVRAEMEICQQETFGPVIAISAFDDEESVLKEANATEYGLAAYLFTNDPQKARRYAARLHCGHVGINTGQGPTPEAPFGGVKHSGFGREGGVEGLLEFTETQTSATAS